MKIIIIGGAHSNVGKTTLLNQILQVLKSYKTMAIKIGCGEENKHKPEKLFNDVNDAVLFIEKAREANLYDILLIESNSILRYVDADCVIYRSTSTGEEKQSAKIIKQKADIILAGEYNIDTIIKLLREKLNLDISA